MENAEQLIKRLIGEVKDMVLINVESDYAGDINDDLKMTISDIIGVDDSTDNGTMMINYIISSSYISAIGELVNSVLDKKYGSTTKSINDRNIKNLNKLIEAAKNSKSINKDDMNKLDTIVTKFNHLIGIKKSHSLMTDMFMSFLKSVKLGSITSEKCDEISSKLEIELLSGSLSNDAYNMMMTIVEKHRPSLI